MLEIVKFLRDEDCVADIPKIVFSYWPYFTSNFHYRTAVVNISIVVSNNMNSPGGLHGIRLLVDKYSINSDRIYNITQTLLEPDNPLSTTFSGQYSVSKMRISTLSKYDGIEQVFVDTAAKYKITRKQGLDIDMLDIYFSKLLLPGKRTAVRFLYTSKQMFDKDRFGTLHFYIPFLDYRILEKYLSEENVLKLLIPVWSTVDEKRNGGLNIFFYMPLEYRGEEFGVDPVARLRPNYNWIGKKTEAPYKKHCWSGARILRKPRDLPLLIGIDNPLRLSGTFSLRTQGITMMKITGKNSFVVGGNIENSTISSQHVVATGNNKEIEKAMSLIETLKQHINELEEEHQKIMLSSLLKPVEQAIEDKKPGTVVKMLDVFRDASASVVRNAPHIASVMENIRNLFVET